MQVRISELIDRAPVSAFQLRAVFLCGLIALLDGLDVQTMALVVPSLSDAWAMPKENFGPVLSSSFAGLMVGALAGGVMGDRYGRRNVLLIAFVVVGLASVLTATSTTVLELAAWRLLTGLGIGACMPNFTVLAAEYVPSQRQATFITVLYAAVPMGGIVGGMLAPVAVEHWGWQAVFILAGAVPLAIAVALFFGLPESPRFLAARGDRHERLGGILERIDAGYRYDPAHEFVIEEKVSGSSVGALFSSGRVIRTALMWTVMLCSLGGFYLVTSWLPSLLTREGWSNFDAARILSVFFFGGVFGCLLVGWLIDRYGPYRVLVGCFAVDAALTGLIGMVSGDRTAALVTMVLAGIAFSCVQTGIVVLASRLYPTSVRSTGVGWGLGMGRLGAVISPLLGGWAIAAGWDIGSFFLAAAVPPALCVAVVLVLQRHMATHDGPTAGRRPNATFEPER